MCGAVRPNSPGHSGRIGTVVETPTGVAVPLPVRPPALAPSAPATRLALLAEVSPVLAEALERLVFAEQPVEPTQPTPHRFFLVLP